MAAPPMSGFPPQSQMVFPYPPQQLQLQPIPQAVHSANELSGISAENELSPAQEELPIPTNESTHLIEHHDSR